MRTSLPMKDLTPLPLLLSHENMAQADYLQTVPMRGLYRQGIRGYFRVAEMAPELGECEGRHALIFK